MSVARGGSAPARTRAMRYLRLQPHVSYGIVGGRAVFLDVNRDRYLALDPAAEAAFSRAREPRQGSISKADQARLLGTKLFELSDEWRPMTPAEVDIPERRVACSGSAGHLRLFGVPEIWFLLWRARHALRAKALGRILASLRNRRLEVTAPASPAATAALAARFNMARALVPIAPSCLQDSIALGFWLARRGACPRIVFGAKLDPFAAHCWLQTDAAILNDAPDTVSPFTPVLVIS